MVNNINLTDVYSEDIVRLLYNFCPGCGADNMPKLYDALIGKAVWVCPICGFDRTPMTLEDDEE